MARSTDFPRTGTAGPAHTRPDIRSELADESTELDVDVTDRAERDDDEIDEGDDFRPDWRQIGTLGLGVAIGVAVGAGVALLLAPMSGEDTRDLIGTRARRIRGRAADRWDDLRDELRYAARRGRKRVRRGATRGKWAAEDAVERTRHSRGW
jgi:gas vesicle protein